MGNQNIQDQQDHFVQKKLNEETFVKLMKSVRPDILILMQLLDKTNVNPIVLYKVIHHLQIIGDGTRYGDIHLIIEDGIVRFINGLQKDKLNESVFLQDQNDTIN